tara:strand:- start:2200 stop:2781 length:582 start_codon:yes stop_codon:yes gene_type:complete
MDYYRILELNDDCSKDEIKKNYRSLSLIYHPDKNNGDDTDFKKINEAYEVLYDDEKRKRYNIQRIFKNIEFTEEDHLLLEKYYQQLIQSNEFKLMKLLYRSIPDESKQSLWRRFKKRNRKDIIRSQKTIDITQLNHNETVHLIIQKSDIQGNTLKIIHILSKNGVYYLYLRDFYNLTINNLDCHLFIKFYQCN